MAGNPQRDIEVFAEAVQLLGEERIAFLDRVCAADKDLRQRIEALLRSNDRVGDFLEEPPTGAIAEKRAQFAAGEKLEIGSAGTDMVFPTLALPI